MKNASIWGIALAVVVTDLYLFPLDLIGTINSKQILAVIGLAMIALGTTSDQAKGMDKEVFKVLGAACAFGLMCTFSVVSNNTTDYTYATYPVTCLVWLCGTIPVVQIIRWVHGEIDVRTMGNYIIAVAAMQCILAQMIDNIPAFSQWVDSMFHFGQSFYKRGHRLYGIGCALDVAGTRMASALVICVFLIIYCEREKSKTLVPIYILAFCLITVLGNMIGRTTTVGALTSLACLILFSVSGSIDSKTNGRLWGWFFGILFLVIPLLIYLYNTDKAVHDNLRFGFEGFFSYFETGKFETNSTNTLQTMYVWPDNMKTWVIGDGYFLGAGNDEFYIGENAKGFFYMDTDVGVCRFIFYCGVIGLSIFAIFFLVAANVCTNYHPEYKWMFYALVCINYAIWLKVATDIFLMLALFLALGPEQEEEEEEDEEEEEIEEEAEYEDCVPAL